MKRGVLLMAAAGLLFAGCKSDKVVINVYNWGEYISDGTDGTLNVNKKFTEETGIKVNYTTFASNEEMYAKIKSNAADYDVIIPSDYMIGRMIEEGMLEKLNFENIPNASKIDSRFVKREYDPTGEYSVPYTWGTVGIIYNTKKVNEPVDSWNILWDKKYEDNILMFNNSRDAFAIACKKLGYSLNTTKKEELLAAAEELKKQKEVIQAYVMDEIFDKMQNGEAALAPYYAGDAITMIDGNPDLAFSVPKEGSNVFIDAMCIPKGAKNKEAAEKYIDFLCRTDIAKANIEFLGYSTPQTEVLEQLDEEIRNNPIIYPPQEVLDRCETMLSLPREAAQEMENLWIRVKL